LNPSFPRVRARELARVASMMSVAASLAACGGSDSPTPAPPPPPVAAVATLASPADASFAWRVARAASVTLTDGNGHAVAPASVTCAAHDASQVTVSADCSQITALRVGPLVIDVSGGGVSAPLSILGTPQRHWSGVHGTSRYAAALVTPDTKALAWGDNGGGMLDQDADPSTLTSLAVATPILVQLGVDFTGAVQSTMGERSGAVVMTDGAVFAWGDDGSRQLGADSATQPTLLPISVFDLTGKPSLEHVVQAEIGDENGVALIDDGTVVNWGNFDGSGSTSNYQLPAHVVSTGGTTALSGIAAVSAGWNFTLALTDDGRVLSWGDDTDSGRLGTGSVFNGVAVVPAWVVHADGTPLTNIVQVSAGYDFSLALAADGTVWAWGDNSYGQLGRAAIGGSSGVAMQVQGVAGAATLSRIAMVAAGGNHALALDLDGRVLAWGYAPDGALGDGPNKPVVNQTSVPRPVVDDAGNASGFTDIASIAAGYADSYALGKDGRVLSWGSNFHGALGRTSTASTDNTPGRVVTAGGALSVPSGTYPNLLRHAR
jgi:alpha-tubulin suppressor-like RCC1 family protein